MQVITYDEMRQLEGGLTVLCAASTIGWAAAEYGVITGFATGGIGFGIAFLGMAVGLYGMMASC